MRYFSLIVSSVFLQVVTLHGQSVDFTRVEATIIPIVEKGEIIGDAHYEFELVKKTDSVFLDAVNITVIQLELNGKGLAYSNSGKRLGIKAPKKLGQHEMRIEYATQPSQAVYFIPSASKGSINTNAYRSGNNLKAEPSQSQIWTQGQGKYTSHWLPSVDDMTDKMEFDLSFSIGVNQVVVSNGKFMEKTVGSQGTHLWKFDMQKPMSSYLTAFAIGNFDKQQIRSKSGVPIELYYEPSDSLHLEPTYRYTKEIFDFLEHEIGVPYPWQNYKQVPVQDFLYAGMENTTCTIFSNQYVIDSTAFVDKNYVNVNAHELAHQWFGNLVTEVNGEHHWLHEGFATYYAYLTEKELFGEDHFYWKLFETAKTLRNFTENSEGEALTNPKASSLTFYEKGAWALVMLREKIGDSVFQGGVKRYLNHFAFGNATITDFLEQMEKASEHSLISFKEEWLENTDFPWTKVKTYLSTKSASLKAYFDIQKRMDSTEFLDEETLNGLFHINSPLPLKRQFVFDYGQRIPDSFLAKILEQEGVEVRQAVALALNQFPRELQSELETLLNDNSYLTQETALYKLWEAFPENRFDYLDQTQGIMGLPNKNVRLLWLTLALVTPDYQRLEKDKWEQELKLYTQPKYHFEIRQAAFQYLALLNQFDVPTLKNLLQACEHHVWQFKKSSRNLLQQLYDMPGSKVKLEQWVQTLSDEETAILKKVIQL